MTILDNPRMPSSNEPAGPEIISTFERFTAVGRLILVGIIGGARADHEDAAEIARNALRRDER